MMKFIGINVIFLLISLAHAKDFSIDSIYSLKVGDNVSHLPKVYESKAFSFDLNAKDGKLVSLSIYFNKLIESKKYLEESHNGHCFAQASKGDFVLYRYFFFNEMLNRSYEVIKDSRLKSITIQNMPEASKHRKCSFKDLIKIKKKQIIQVKK
jgi:hypothetical protein